MGGPAEEPDDVALAYWGGHIPLRLVTGEPVPDELVQTGVPEPEYSIDARRAAPAQ